MLPAFLSETLFDRAVGWLHGAGALALAIYCASVDFMLQLAAMLHITYRDANALLFFVVWPAVTCTLVATVWLQRRALRRLAQKPRPRSSRNSSS